MLSRSRIDYLTHVWNPAVGCEAGCPYCWARRRWAPRMARVCPLCAEFVPHVHPERLDDVTPQQGPKVIGLGFFTELSRRENWPVVGRGRWTPADLWMALVSVVDRCPQHTFVTPTRRPDLVPHQAFIRRPSLLPGKPSEIEPPPNWWLLVTCSTAEEFRQTIYFAQAVWRFRRWVLNLEPWREPFVPSDVSPDWKWACGGVIVGDLSGDPDAEVPTDDDYRRLRHDVAGRGVPFYIKQRRTPDGMDHSGILDGEVWRELPWDV